MKPIVGSIFIVLVSQLIGQIIPPFSILLGTMVFIPIAVGFINFSNKAIFGIRFEKKLPIVQRIVLLYLCVTICSILDFLYAPGTHDSEGDAAILVSSYVALLVGCVTMIRYLLKERKAQMSKVSIGQIVLIILVPIVWIVANCIRGNILYEIFG